MFSEHARQRNQQRCIPLIVHDWLSQFGSEQYDHRGGIKVYFSKSSRKRMERVIGKQFVRQNSHYLNAYRVESSRDGSVITAGYLTKRIWR